MSGPHSLLVCTGHFCSGSRQTKEGTNKVCFGKKATEEKYQGQHEGRVQRRRRGESVYQLLFEVCSYCLDYSAKTVTTKCQNSVIIFHITLTKFLMGWS